MRERKTIEPQDLLVLVDTREQLPLDLSPLRCEKATLTTGDYTVKGLEAEIAIERKSLSDLLGCVGRDRERFDKEVKRLLAYPVRALVVEATWHDLEMGNFGRSTLQPQTVMGSVLGWMAYGLPVMMAGNRTSAARYVSRLLFIAARRRWYELQSFYKSLKIVGSDPEQPIKSEALHGF